MLLIDGKYGPAFDIYRLAEQVAQQIGDKEGIATTALNIGSVYYFQGNYDLALENYRRAQKLFVSLANAPEAAQSQFGIALTLQAQKKPTEALKVFEQALKEFEALNDRNRIADTLAGIGSIQNEQGNYDAAAKTFLRVAGLRENAESLLRIGEALYRQNDYAQALVYYERALEHAERQRNPAQLLGAVNGAANCYYNQRNYDQALGLYLRSLAVSESLNDKAGAATQLQSIGNIYRAVGDYESALQNYFKSLATAADATTKATVATTLGGIGVVRSLQGDNRQAIEYFDKSLSAFETSGDVVGMARMLSYIGNAQYISGEYDLALAAYEKSLALYRAKADKVNQAHVLLGVGAVYVSQQKFAPALESYQQALAIYEESGRKTDAADTLMRLAAAHRLQGQPAIGLDFANRAVRLLQPGDSPALHSLALTEVGRLQRGLSRQPEALAAFTEAIKIQKSADSSLAGSETERSGVLPYLGAMEVLVDQENAIEALRRADEAKSQLLSEIVNRSGFRVIKDMTAAEQKEERRLLGEVASIRAQLTSKQEAADTRAKALRDRLAATRTAYESFRKQLYARHPQLAANRGDLAPVNPAALASLLRRDAAILEYAVTEDDVFLFVITHEAKPVVKAYRLALKPKELAQRTSRELYDLLAKPAEPQIATKTKIIIVPDGPVWNVPFEGLFAEQKTVSYTVSVSALQEMRKRKQMRRAGPPTVLVVENPVLKDDLLERLETTYSGLRLRDAAAASVESTAVRSIYGKSRTQLYTGATATKERVKKEASAHKFIHFATPVILNQSAPLYSFIVLSGDPNASDDGLLRLREVINLNSRVDVVMFSAASFTGTQSQPGNAFIATSWAWFVAGTPTVILTRPNAGLMIIGDWGRFEF